jgi:hypothetical protein
MEEKMIRNIPGTINVEGREFVYIECRSKEAFVEIFPKIITIAGGDLPKKGGMINENATITLPDGKQLYGLSYKGDLKGWRSKIVGCCKKLDSMWGEIEKDNIKLSNGEKITFDKCDIDLY